MTMNDYMTLGEFTYNWMGCETTFFSRLNEMGLEVPWNNQDLAQSLDWDYYGNHSGSKYISPLARKLVHDNYVGDKVLQADRDMLYTIIYNKYIDNWNSLWDAMTAEYNPIENYNMVEDGNDTNDNTTTYSGSETDTTTKSGSENHSITKTGSETDTNVQSGTRETKTSGGWTDKRSAFNSDTLKADTGREYDTTDGVTETESFGTGSKEYKDVNTKTFANRQDSDALTFNNRQDATTKTFNNRQDVYDGDTTHHLTRSGNIGVTTAQQMIESEIELRKQNFFDLIYKDLDKVLALMIY